MATTVELFGLLEKKVADAEAKLKVLADAEKAQSKAQADYDAAVSEVGKLKEELTTKIGDLLPSSRVRIAKAS